MSDVWLIYNFGTQEPWIKAREGFILLKDRGRPLERLLGTAEGLWTSGEIVGRASANEYELKFPILEPMRLVGVGAQALFALGLVGLIVAFAPDRLAAQLRRLRGGH